MVIRFLKNLILGGQGPGGLPGRTAMAPARPFYAVGDVHGRDDLLAPLLDTIAQDAAARGHAADIVFLGDLIDRGLQSAQALARTRDWLTASPGSTVLLGNHEEMLIDFLDDPAMSGARWLRHGGIATLESFGIPGPRDVEDPDELLDLSDRLVQVLGGEGEGSLGGWLRTLPVRWESGNVHCVHAAMDPAYPPDLQTRKTLVWGNADFLRERREDGQWVIHGHVVVRAPKIAGGRIAIDTGAYKTGVLTAAAIGPDGSCRFLQQTG